MSQYVESGAAAVEIERHEQLIEYFFEGGKPPGEWGIGTEYEKVAVRRGSGQAVPFSGNDGIEAVLKLLAERYSWIEVREGDRVVALRGDKASITLEPGGQLELSGEVCDTVHCARAEFSRHIDEIVTIGSDLDIEFLGLGIQPVSRVADIEWVPKRRYRIMGPYMPKVGNLGVRMMSQTATVQVNLDFGDEADAMMKMRVGMGLAPLVTAMFANSPLTDGDLNGFLSYRAHIWTDTDPARCGLLPFLFESSASFERYADYALDVPMYFIVRKGVWMDLTHLTFREFLKNGYRGHRATMDDWDSHLTTLFPEVRTKRYIELRSADSQSPELMLAVPALAKGIFYETDCLLAAWDLVKRWSWDERLELYHNVPRQALRAVVRRLPLYELASELLAIATAGLERQGAPDANGENEAQYLEGLRELVERRLCPADLVIEKWIGAWDREIARLVEGSSYRIAA
jgi:glutamate--cysteine ligase